MLVFSTHEVTFRTEPRRQPLLRHQPSAPTRDAALAHLSPLNLDLNLNLTLDIDITSTQLPTEPPATRIAGTILRTSCAAIRFNSCTETVFEQDSRFGTCHDQADRSRVSVSNV